MRRSVLILAALAVLVLVAPAAARADAYIVGDDDAPPARGWLALGFGVTHDNFYSLRAEGAARLGEAPLFLHGAIGSGSRAMLFETGSFNEAMIGVEARGCLPTWLCGYADADVAGEVYRFGTLPVHVAPSLLGAVGLDVGADTLRVRFGMGPRVTRGRDDQDVLATRVGLDATISIGGQW